MIFLGEARCERRRWVGLQRLRLRASFGDMVLASKLLVIAAVFCCCVPLTHAQGSPPSSVAAQQVAELQFELARSLASAGEHDAAAREFDRALTLQRHAANATPEQTQAAMQTLRAYVESRPELPRMREIGRKLAAAERQVPASSPMMPNAPLSGAATAPPPVALNPYRHPTPQPVMQPASPPSSTRPAASRSDSPPPATAQAGGYQLQPQRRPPAGSWWEITLSADELLIPAEWDAALRAARGSSWPQLAMVWPELLVPEGWGWEHPTGGFAAMLLLDAELLVPPGW